VCIIRQPYGRDAQAQQTSRVAIIDCSPATAAGSDSDSGRTSTTNTGGSVQQFDFFDDETLVLVYDTGGEREYWFEWLVMIMIHAFLSFIRFLSFFFPSSFSLSLSLHLLSYTTEHDPYDRIFSSSSFLIGSTVVATVTYHDARYQELLSDISGPSHEHLAAAAFQEWRAGHVSTLSFAIPPFIMKGKKG
jgi:hypothetical protein